MKNHILLAGAVATSLALGSAARAQSTFPDVPDNHWAAQAVRRLAEAGIIEGFPAQPQAAPAAKIAAQKTPKTASAKAGPRAANQARRAPKK